MTKQNGVVIRKTTEDWDQVSQTNQVHQDMQRVKRWVTNTCNGVSRAAIICGEPGCGKTHAIDEAIMAVIREGVEPIRVMIRDYEHMLEVFRQSKGHRPIILEECDSIFKSKRQLNVLKQALDDSETAPKFTFTSKGQVNWGAPVVFALNMDIRNDALFDKALVADVAAIRSRVPPVVVTTQPIPMWEYACYLAIRQNLIRYYRKKVKKGKVTKEMASAKQQNTVLKFYTDNLFRLADRSPRGLQKIAQAVYLAKTDAEMWSDLQPLLTQSEAMAAASAPDGWPFYYPEIVVTPHVPKKKAKPKKDAKAETIVEPDPVVVPEKKPRKRPPKMPPQADLEAIATVLEGVVAEKKEAKEQDEMTAIMSFVDAAVIPYRGSSAEDVLKRVERDNGVHVPLGTIVGALKYLEKSKGTVRCTREGFWRRAV